MRFMHDDEFLLLMVHCEDRANGYDKQHILTVPERIRLREVGIQTAHEQPSWASIEPKQGQYDFAYLDRIIQRNRDAGLKSLIQISGWRIPAWVPAEWRPKTLNGNLHDDMLSIWNEEAQAYNDAYYRMLYDKYNAHDIEFFFGEFQGGEGAIPPSHCFYEDAAIKSFQDMYGTLARPDLNNAETMNWLGQSVIKHFIRKASILYPRYNEVWNAQQFLMDRWSKAYGNFVQPDILKKFREMWPDGNIILLQYTYFDSAHDDECKNYVDMLVNISGCEVIAEAMFCAGLATTTPASIAKGFRGQIVHPANDINGEVLNDWMVEEVRKSHELWRASRENHSELQNAQ